MIIGNSESNQFGAQGTFNTVVSHTTEAAPGLILALNGRVVYVSHKVITRAPNTSTRAQRTDPTVDQQKVKG